MSILLRADSAGSNPISAFGIVAPRRLVRWFARLWISAEIVGSLLPGWAKVELHARGGDRTHSRNAANGKHRLVHFIAFGSSFLVLSILATTKREQLEAAVEVMTIGCVVEVIQYFLYSHRQVFEWWAVRDDAIGIALAFLLVQIASLVNSAITARGHSKSRRASKPSLAGRW
jgi:hypothetical protein